MSSPREPGPPSGAAGPVSTRADADGSRRSWGRRLAALVLGSVLALAVLELGLRIAGSLGGGAENRAAAAEGGFRILCIGDSNTYGAGVERDESYPAQLQRLLDARDDGVDYRVINLGVPATNSSQHLANLGGYVDYLEPSLLVVTSGVNDYWTAPVEVEPEAWGRRLHHWLLGLRTYEFAFLLRESARRRAEVARVERVRNQQFAVGPGNERETSLWLQEVDGRVVQYDKTRRPESLAETAHRELAAANLARMEEVAAARRVPIVFATYAADLGPYAVANRAILDLESRGRRVLSQIYPDGLSAHLGAIPPEERRDLFLPDLHPKARLYAVLAANLADYLDREGLLPTSPSR